MKRELRSMGRNQNLSKYLKTQTIRNCANFAAETPTPYQNKLRSLYLLAVHDYWSKFQTFRSSKIETRVMETS